MKKLTVRIALSLVAVFLLWRVYGLITSGTEDGQRGPSRPPVAVEVDQPIYGTISETRQLTGTVHPLYQYIIAPKVSGRVVDIRKRIGDWLDKGEVVARIDDAEYQQDVFEAEANLKIAEAGLIEAQSRFELAQQDLERMQSLQAKGMISSAEFDVAAANHKALESRLKLARAQVDQRQAALKSAKIRSGYTILAASQPGFVGERFVDEGALLAPNSPVLSVIGIDTVFVRTTVIERDYGSIRPGQSAQVSVDAFPDQRFIGKVTRIAPRLAEASRVAEMEVEVANASQILKPGMFAKVTVVLQEKQDTQIVPSQAIVTRNGQHGVFLVKNGETVANYVPVETGIVAPEKTEIVSPQLEGLVVTLGQHLLEDGGPVILPQNTGTTPND